MENKNKPPAAKRYKAVYMGKERTHTLSTWSSYLSISVASIKRSLEKGNTIEVALRLDGVKNAAQFLSRPMVRL